MTADKLSTLVLNATEANYDARGFHAQHTASVRHSSLRSQMPSYPKIFTSK